MTNLDGRLNSLITNTLISGLLISNIGCAFKINQNIELQKLPPVISKPFDHSIEALKNEKEIGLLTKTKQEIERQRLEQERIAKEKLAMEQSKRPRIASVSRGGDVRAYYNVGMSKEHQQYLAVKCSERGLDFKDMMAVIEVESSYNPNNITDKYYGYFQVGIINHKTLASTLNTPNSPLDPYVNIDWGTYMFADLYSQFKAKGYIGNELREVVLSSFNKGIGGFNKTGKAVGYINKVNKAYGSLK